MLYFKYFAFLENVQFCTVKELCGVCFYEIKTKINSPLFVSFSEMCLLLPAWVSRTF